MSLLTRREVNENGRVTIVLYSENPAGERRDSYAINLDGRHGGTTIHKLSGHLFHDDGLEPNQRPLGYLYPDSDDAICAAWRELIDERKRNIASDCEAEIVRRKTDTRKVFHGLNVDLSPAEAYAVLVDAQWRIVEEDRGGFGPLLVIHILYIGEWLRLGRADLKDNVATGLMLSRDDPDPVKYYRENTKFGARIQHGCFSVVDAFSDG